MKSNRNRRSEVGGRRSVSGRLAATCLLVAAISAGGCRQDMHNTPVGQPLRASMFFKDASSARPLVEGTVARGTLQDDQAFYTGKNGATDADALPFALTAEVLDRGENRFNIYCTPCHGLSGQGDGMIVRRGYRAPPSFHTDRMQQMAIGHFYDVMTNGFGAMPDYRAQISPRDRWAIAAYVRALQLSQHASAAELSAEERAKLSQPGAATEHKQ
jgi:mono/diheme cytochrome c family protein